MTQPSPAPVCSEEHVRRYCETDGSEVQAGWFFNVGPNPTDKIQVTANGLTASARTGVKDQTLPAGEAVIRVFPACADFRQDTDRLLPVVVLGQVSP